MGAEIQPKNMKIYQQVYQASFYVLNQQYEYHPSNSYLIFDHLFSNFQGKSTKYEWMTSIPLMIRKYFGNVLQDVRKKAKEQFYKVLDDVLLKPQNSKGSPEKHEIRFFSKINETLLQQQKNVSIMVRDSLLFEDDVVMLCTDIPMREIISDSMFRESIFTSQQKPKHRAIMKEAIFIENLSAKDQEEIALVVEMYNRFANILEGLMRNVSFCSLLLRHFEESLKEKRIRKKLKVNKQTERSSSIFQEESRGETARQRQKYNQTLLLQEVSDFVELYTAFVWDFYDLNEIKKVKFGTLITYENITSLILNTVWTRVNWIGLRGSEYQEQLLKMYILKHVDSKQLITVKPEVLSICQNMTMNPMKYLKQVTLLYRQIVRGFKNATADDLLIAYRSLFYELAKKNLLLGKLRMIEIVNLIWSGQKNGQVGYAWITWQAGFGMLLAQAEKYKLSELA